MNRLAIAIVFAVVTLCGCDAFDFQEPARSVVLPPSPAGFGETVSHDADPASASVKPAGDADKIAALEAEVAELKGQLAALSRQAEARQYIQPTAPPAVGLKRALVYSPSWCSGCQQFERTTVGNGEFDFMFVHEEAKFPKEVREAISNGQVYPVVHFEAAPGKWRFLFGPTSFKQFKDHYGRCLKNPTLNTAPARPGHRTPHLVYGLYRSVYDWPGDLRQHLMNSPHNLAPQYVASLSDEQAISVHDQWHIQHDAARRRGPLARVFGRG
jgi:hypothetical protein